MKYPQTESTGLELKREIPRNDQIVKTIIGFCNQSGGKLIVGVDDDGTIVGVPEKDVEFVLESVESSIYDACSPKIIPRIATQNFGDKLVIIIEVSEGMNKPYHRKAEGLEKGTYIRLGKQTARASSEIIQELEWQARGIDFECMPVYQATIDDLNLDRFKQFLQNRKNHAGVDVSDEVINAYRIVTKEHTKNYPTTLGVVLFGKQPQQFITEAMIICTHFQGTSGRDVVATVDCTGTLFDQFKQAHAFILDRLYSSFKIAGLKRDEKLEVPEIAIREALLNMIVHRNYHIKAPNKIAIYDDRIEFFSPGQFPGPLDPNNLLNGITYLRNPVICKILREANYLEKLGSGFINIFQSYEEHQLQAPVVIEGENYIKCILPRKSQVVSESVSDAQKLEQLFMVKHEVSINDVIKYLSVSRSTALRRLNELLGEDKIERHGQKKAARYCKK